MPVKTLFIAILVGAVSMVDRVDAESCVEGQSYYGRLTTVAEIPPRLGRIAEFFTKNVDQGEMETVLSALSPEGTAFVLDRFLRPSRPWRLGERPMECGRLQDCATPPPGHRWLTRPAPEWPVGPVLAVGDGETISRTEFPEGTAPIDVYTPTGPTRETVLMAPVRNRQSMFLVIGTDGATSVSERLEIMRAAISRCWP